VADAVIENPILNSPFRAPSLHWRFGDTGITNEVVEERRVSSYFMPIPASKVRSRQLELETEWTRDRIEENRLINQVRERVAAWRSLRYPGVTPVTRRLIEYWMDESPRVCPAPYIGRPLPAA
jgi:type III restriction enzyme